MRCSHWVCMYL